MTNKNTYLYFQEIIRILSVPASLGQADVAKRAVSGPGHDANSGISLHLTVRWDPSSQGTSTVTTRRAILFISTEI